MSILLSAFSPTNNFLTGLDFIGLWSVAKLVRNLPRFLALGGFRDCWFRIWGLFGHLVYCSTIFWHCDLFYSRNWEIARKWDCKLPNVKTELKSGFNTTGKRLKRKSREGFYQVLWNFLVRRIVDEYAKCRIFWWAINARHWNVKFWSPDWRSPLALCSKFKKNNRKTRKIYKLTFLIRTICQKQCLFTLKI